MDLRARVVSKSFVLILCLLTGSACSYFGSSAGSSPDNSYIRRLENRGIVPLSPTNPFIAANALLNKEMEASPELKGFVSTRGAPAAIEVEHGYFSTLKINMYYPQFSEKYRAEFANGIWLINGPFPIEQDIAAEINKVIVYNKQDGLKMPLPKPAFPAEEKSPPMPAPTAKPSPEAMPVKIPPPAVTPAASVTPSLQSEDQSTRALKEIVLSHGKALAEISPRGDIVHYVSYPGETMAMIARWYTFEVQNQQRIARINHITGPLSLGDTVVIPGYLVKNKYILTEAVLSALEKAVSEGKIS